MKGIARVCVCMVGCVYSMCLCVCMCVCMKEKEEGGGGDENENICVVKEIF